MTEITDQRRFARPSQPTTVTADAVEHAIRHTTLRALGFGGMLAIALIHLLDVIVLAVYACALARRESVARQVAAGR